MMNLWKAASDGQTSIKIKSLKTINILRRGAHAASDGGVSHQLWKDKRMPARV